MTRIVKTAIGAGALAVAVLVAFLFLGWTGRSANGELSESKTEAQGTSLPYAGLEGLRRVDEPAGSHAQEATARAPRRIVTLSDERRPGENDADFQLRLKKNDLFEMCVKRARLTDEGRNGVLTVLADFQEIVMKAEQDMADRANYLTQFGPNDHRWKEFDQQYSPSEFYSQLNKDLKLRLAEVLPPAKLELWLPACTTAGTLRDWLEITYDSD